MLKRSYSVTFIVKIERPNDSLQGMICFIRTQGEPGLYLQLIQRFAKTAAKKKMMKKKQKKKSKAIAMVSTASAKHNTTGET